MGCQGLNVERKSFCKSESKLGASRLPNQVLNMPAEGVA
jgi:hypothetical protein